MYRVAANFSIQSQSTNENGQGLIFRCLILLLLSFGWGCYSRTGHTIHKEQMKMHFNII